MKLAVIPSNGRECLNQCVAAIEPQVDHIIIIAAGDSAVLSKFTALESLHSKKLTVHRTYVKNNISAWWNQGFASAKSKAHRRKEWKVAVLNDDAIVSENWFDAVACHMDVANCVTGCSGPVTSVLRDPGPVPLHVRMVGYAYIIRGEAEIRANEDLHWYFTDDYIDWESRKRGGMGMTEAAPPVEHLYPNGQLTPELHAQIAQDAQTFVDIYGQRPW